MKINSLRLGRFSIIFIDIVFLLAILCSFFFPIDIRWIIVFLLLVIGLGVTIYFYRLGAFNFVYVDGQGIKNKATQYDWKNVCITVSTYNKGGGLIPPYRAYFADKFLKENEIADIEKLGMYLDLHPNRMYLILSFYNKPIEILQATLYPRVTKLIEEHNQKYNKM